MALSGNSTPTSDGSATPNYNTGYNYNQPNINASNVAGQTINGQQNVGGYNMPDLTGISATQNQNSQNFNQSQANQVAAFQGANQAAVNALPTFQQLNQQANQQYNVPNLANTATQLNNTVLQIPQTYSQATQGSDTNNNQLMQLIGQKQWELDPLAQAATNSAQTAQGLANTSVGYGVQNEAQQLSPYANAAPLLQNQMASAATNFTQDQANQLSTLQALVASGAQLSANQATQLASLENSKRTYDAAVATANATVAASKNYAIPQGGVAYNGSSNTAYSPYNKILPT